jgi:hypothetical protein
MKRLTLYTLVLVALISPTAHAQNPTGAKPKLFSNFPEKIICSAAELSRIFTTNADQNISLSFSDNFLFSGTVTSNVVKYANLQTAVIKSPVFGDAVFAVSKITHADKSVSYIGRIISKKYFDGFELKKDTQNNYQLTKIETDRVIQDCSHN